MPRPIDRRDVVRRVVRRAVVVDRRRRVVGGCRFHVGAAVPVDVLGARRHRPAARRRSPTAGRGGRAARRPGGCRSPGASPGRAAAASCSAGRCIRRPRRSRRCGSRSCSPCGSAAPGTGCGGFAPASTLLPIAEPATTPTPVAAARPKPWPNWLPMTPPAIAPISAPAPDGCCWTSCCTWAHSWRGTATELDTGVDDTTRAYSAALAFAARPNTAATDAAAMAARGGRWVFMAGCLLGCSLKGRLRTRSRVRRDTRQFKLRGRR